MGTTGFQAGGGYRYLEPPDVVTMIVRLVNQSRTPINLPEKVDQLISLQLVAVDRSEPVVVLDSHVVTWIRDDDAVASPPRLAAQEAVEVAFHYRTVGANLPKGEYVLRLDLTSVAADARTDGGSPWPGSVPLTSQKRVLVEPAATREESIRGQALRAQVDVARGDWDSARGRYRDLATAAPDSPAGALGLGRLELSLGNFEQAAVWLQRVVDLGISEESLTPRSLALALVGAGDESRARAILRELPLEASLESELERLRKAAAVIRARSR